MLRFADQIIKLALDLLDDDYMMSICGRLMVFVVSVVACSVKGGVTK